MSPTLVCVLLSARLNTYKNIDKNFSIYIYSCNFQTIFFLMCEMSLFIFRQWRNAWEKSRSACQCGGIRKRVRSEQGDYLTHSDWLVVLRMIQLHYLNSGNVGGAASLQPWHIYVWAPHLAFWCNRARPLRLDASTSLYYSGSEQTKHNKPL